MQSLIIKQNGSALFVTLIILALLMIIGASTLNSSIVDLKIANNTWQSMDSSQKAEAGINATISLIGTANDPFNGIDNINPFASIPDPANNPLQHLEDEVDVATIINIADGQCGRSVLASSNNLISCEYYQINSTHNALNNNGVTTTIIQGISREIIAQ